jgi:hypothetical protein
MYTRTLARESMPRLHAAHAGEESDAPSDAGSWDARSLPGGGAGFAAGSSAPAAFNSIALAAHLASRPLRALAAATASGAGGSPRAAGGAGGGSFPGGGAAPPAPAGKAAGCVPARSRRPLHGAGCMAPGRRPQQGSCHACMHAWPAAAWMVAACMRGAGLQIC